MTEEQLAALHSDQCAPRCPTCLAIDLKAARDAERWVERRGCIELVIAMAQDLEKDDPLLAGVLRLAAVKMAERPR